ncbi:MAG TPA: hypothetical protein ACFYD6_10165 [Candidatus Brocadiia bacterium]|nr:hypothetical protein [Candidatus Brocadiales bacterium]
MQECQCGCKEVFRAFKIAFDVKKIFLGFAGFAASLIWTVVIIALLRSMELITIGPEVILSNVFRSPHIGAPQLWKVFLSTIKSLNLGNGVSIVLLVLGLLIIWSFVGGAITRLSAVEYARNESIKLSESVKFASNKFWSYFWAPLAPAVGVMVFMFCNILGGLIGQIKFVGELFIGLGFPLVIISSFLIIFIALVGLLGLGLMFPTISAEGSDAFDAMSRAYSYTITKPKSLLCYCFTAIVSGGALVLFIALVACCVFQTSFDTINIGMGQKFDAIRGVVKNLPTTQDAGAAAQTSTGLAALSTQTLKITAVLIMFYIGLTNLIIGGIASSFLFSAKTIIYFLMRKEVDGTEITDVYMEEKKEESTLGGSTKAPETGEKPGENPGHTEEKSEETEGEHS